MKFEKLANSKFEKLETATMLKITGGAVAGGAAEPTGKHYDSNPDCGCEHGGKDFMCTD